MCEYWCLTRHSPSTVIIVHNKQNYYSYLWHKQETICIYDSGVPVWQCVYIWYMYIVCVYMHVRDIDIHISVSGGKHMADNKLMEEGRRQGHTAANIFLRTQTHAHTHTRVHTPWVWKQTRTSCTRVMSTCSLTVRCVLLLCVYTCMPTYVRALVLDEAFTQHSHYYS